MLAPTRLQRGRTSTVTSWVLGIALSMTLAPVVAGCSTLGLKSSPAPAPSPSPTSAVLEPVEALPEGLFLQVYGPANESTVYETSVFVQGATAPDAVLSVDDSAIDVDANGEFGAVVDLAPGPNLIEVVASDLKGNQESVLLTLVYLQ